MPGKPSTTHEIPLSVNAGLTAGRDGALKGWSFAARWALAWEIGRLIPKRWVFGKTLYGAKRGYKYGY